MTWTANGGWQWNHRTQTYILRRAAGTARVWESPETRNLIVARPRWWLGNVTYSNGAVAWLTVRADRRHVQWQAEELLQPSTVGAA